MTDSVSSPSTYFTLVCRSDFLLKTKHMEVQSAVPVSIRLYNTSWVKSVRKMKMWHANIVNWLESKLRICEFLIRIDMFAHNKWQVKSISKCSLSVINFSLVSKELLWFHIYTITAVLLLSNDDSCVQRFKEQETVPVALKKRKIWNNWFTIYWISAVVCDYKNRLMFLHIYIFGGYSHFLFLPPSLIKMLGKKIRQIKLLVWKIAKFVNAGRLKLFFFFS